MQVYSNRLFLQSINMLILRLELILMEMLRVLCYKVLTFQPILYQERLLWD